METVMLVISIVSMIATVISTIIAIKAKNEAKVILTEIKSGDIKSNNQRHNIKNKGKIDINNSGNNEGVMAGIVSGGIQQHDK